MQTRGHCKALGRFGFGFWVPREKPMHEDGPQNALHPPSPFQPAPKGGFGAGAPHPRAVVGGDGFGASPKWLIGGHQPLLWALHPRCNTTAPLPPPRAFPLGWLCDLWGQPQYSVSCPRGGCRDTKWFGGSHLPPFSSLPSLPPPQPLLQRCRMGLPCWPHTGFPSPSPPVPFYFLVLSASQASGLSQGLCSPLSPC